MNKETFQKNIMALQGAFRYVLPKESFWIYWVALRKYPDNEIERATKALVSGFIPTSACPFPVPGHFIDEINNCSKEIPESQRMYLPLTKDDLPTPEEVSLFMADFKNMVKTIAREKSMKGSK